jgi:outer membrane murein-binding lipoprotein Lpp
MLDLGRYGWARLLLASMIVSIAVYGGFELGMSDYLSNKHGAELLGSAADTKDSFKHMALGLVLAACIFGALWSILNERVYFGMIIAVSLLSGCLTLASSSTDFATNDQKAKNSAKQLEGLNAERSALLAKMDECRRDQYYKPCTGIESRLREISSEISGLASSSTASSESAIDGKTILPGWLIQGIIIFGKAFIVPLAYSFLFAASVKILFKSGANHQPVKKAKNESNETQTTRTETVSKSVQPKSGKGRTEIAKSGTGKKSPSEETAKRKIDDWKQTENGQKWIKEKGDITDNKLRSICKVGQKKIDEWSLNDYANRKNGFLKLVKRGA